MSITLGQFIKNARKNQKITQSKLAEMIGKKTITIRKYESDEINPSIEVLEKIAKALKIDVWDLLEISTKTPFNPVQFMDDEDKEFLVNLGYIKDNKLIPNVSLNLEKRELTDGLKTLHLPISFNEMKSEVDKIFPALQPEIDFLSNPNIEMVFNYSYNDLAKKGYDELLINAIEKAIRTTLEDIETHLNNGDLFDGVGSWISKDSPLYEVIKKHREEK